MSTSPALGAIVASLLFLAAQPISADTPDWVRKAAALPTPNVSANTPAVVLLDENVVELNDRGVAIETNHVAIRILNTSGTKFARRRISYIDKTDRVEEATAWIMRGGKTAKTIEKSEWVDVAEIDNTEVFGEYRAKMFNAHSDTTPGDVVAIETVLREPLLVAQLRYTWGWNLPVQTESFEIHLPPGFKIQTTLHGSRTPTSTTSNNGTILSWSLQDQPYFEDEPWAPELTRSAADLQVLILPPPNASRFAPKVFQAWSDVADWADSLCVGQCDDSPQIAEAVRKLTANATDTLTKIRALGAYVQSLRYVAIDKDLGKGFGYKPRKAADVFSQGYGDCKDKANLLRRMLTDAGIRSYLVSALVDDNFEVWPEVPSPLQFNHAILGIAVDDTIQLPAVTSGADHERLLFFDPTDPHTAVGDLPRDLQGSRVLVIKKNVESLVVLPQIPLEHGHTVERKATLTLAADGSVTGNVCVTGLGQPGAYLRHRLFRASSAKELNEVALDLLNDSAHGFQLQDEKKNDDPANDRCALTFALSNKQFVQPLRNELAIARLDILSRSAIPTFPAKERRRPIELKPLVQQDEVSLELPAGYSVEELPAAATLDTPYGTYERAFEQRGNTVVLKRHLTLKRQTVPVDDYIKVKQFFSDLAKADHASVLLKRV